MYLYSGVGVGVRAAVLPGTSTIDPNVGFTSFALGARAALDVLSGHLPLWNHFEGLGAPLLGEMQSAALFPPTLLLTLPHGQVLEQALLQLVAGVGSFLFFRRFGLGTRAALTGGLLYEVNGVFAWLHNAVFNPVAFLPWLFFVIESLRIATLDGRRLAQRLPIICLGAGMAAAALYAGFPEEVYLYSLLLTGWAVFRMAGFTVRQAVSFISDLILTGLVGLSLSAPLLLAFVDFLGEASLGGHGDNGFDGTWLNIAALVQYIMPYTYGPIFASTNPTIARIWGGIGGYIGFMPMVVAFAGLFVPHQRPVKFFLLAWIVIALGASHGLPGVYRAFMTLPLTGIAACYRYLNASWIFCIIFLGAMFLDRMPALPPLVLRRILGWAVASSLGLTAAAMVGAWPLIGEYWAISLCNRGHVLGALAIVAALSFAALRITRSTNGQSVLTAMSCILVAEAAAWFFFPYLSYPRKGGLDLEAVSFLQSHVGYQRIAAITGNGVGPNYGSYFGIPTLNYNDLPVPQRTSSYIKDNLDPYADPLIFLPEYPPTSSEQQTNRRKVFLERLPRYAEAGVKYLLAEPTAKFEMPLVYQGRSMTIYALPGTRDYFSADFCELRPLSRDLVDASCSRPAKLTRLEVSMHGWLATIDGRPASIGLADNTFQTLDLPAGVTHIEFEYRPRGVRTAMIIACVALLLVSVVLVRAGAELAGGGRRPTKS
ncbi:hypothetical protein [Telmatospirillum sp.]|uniref:hypothetical protein n=1 Tax=Telmatospirillum sp. TaxID=2079197 RepID=UPI0028464A1D|nr:hypothetical protein [Telmatospirillum sp.]MDR3438331.1 hypothetical protein [Telmatospirillum sp.]